MSAPQEVLDAFQRQLTEHKQYGLIAAIVKTANDLETPPRLWREQIMVDIHLGMFLEQHPHLHGARNIPNIRKAILVDLISRGIL
jgi:hypothetical protein